MSPRNGNRRDGIAAGNSVGIRSSNDASENTRQQDTTQAPAAADYFETRSKKGRGMARRSLDLIEAMYAAAEPHSPSPDEASGTSCSPPV
jgi:hypothetical protein